MNKLIGNQISWNHALLGTVLAGIGLIGLFYAPAIVSIFSLSIASYWALRLVYGKEAVKQLFGKPIAPVKTSSKYFLLNILISFLVSLVLQYGLKWDLHGNPVNEGFHWLTLLVIPIMLFGEELFSIFFLAIFSSKCTLSVASILSAIIFGLVHYSTYDNGNVFHTLVHILFIQGVARLLFNQAAIKSNSILTSWGTHVLFDLFAILVAYLTA